MVCVLGVYIGSPLQVEMLRPGLLLQLFWWVSMDYVRFSTLKRITCLPEKDVWDSMVPLQLMVIFYYAVVGLRKSSNFKCYQH